VFKHYFEVVEEESIRDNFVTVYELLDEVRCGGGCAAAPCAAARTASVQRVAGAGAVLCDTVCLTGGLCAVRWPRAHPPQVMDYGYPQFTEAQIMQEFIKTDSYRMEVVRARGAVRAAAGGGGCRQQQQQLLAPACSGSSSRPLVCALASRADAFVRHLAACAVAALPSAGRRQAAHGRHQRSVLAQ
jgi:hypothetical protein